jgi:hypothetical protein
MNRRSGRFVDRGSRTGVYEDQGQDSSGVFLRHHFWTRTFDWVADSYSEPSTDLGGFRVERSIVWVQFFSNRDDLALVFADHRRSPG